MTLEEFKGKVYQLIEEYNENAEDLTDDQDLSAKMNSVINTIMNEVARIKKIDAYMAMDVEFEDGEDFRMIDLKDIDKKLYQINIIRGVESQVDGTKIIFFAEGKAHIFYYKYPVQIDEETDDDYVFELDNECLEVMVYGVAGDLLKADVSANYGKLYSERYEQMLQRLDPRRAMGSLFIDGGIDI